VVIFGRTFVIKYAGRLSKILSFIDYTRQ